MPEIHAWESCPNLPSVVCANSCDVFPEHHSHGNTGLPVLVVKNPLGYAVLAFQGAQLLAFRPSGKREMLWLSPRSVFEAGKLIRGGVPLCLPWFGLGPDGKSMHGFVRTMNWSLSSVRDLVGGVTSIVLELARDTPVNALWPHPFVFRLEIHVGTALTMTLTATNRDCIPVPLAFAFHTYFNVPDVTDVCVGGLDGVSYIDKADVFARKIQKGDVTITGTTDRIYQNVPQQQTLTSSTDVVRIESDSRCAVVWNAWTNDRNIVDIGEGNHAHYICVERGDIADHAQILSPGASYQATMRLAY